MSGKASYALITGGSQGLGRAFAEECAARGKSLILVALPGSGLDEVGRSIAESWGVSVDWLEADLTAPDTVDRLLGLIRSKGASLDLLVNNAGIGTPALFMQRPLEYQEEMVRLNILAMMRLTRRVLEEPDRSPNLRILNVASLSAFFPMPYLPVYSATKSFVLSFSLALREEMSGSVGVSVLCPNAIRTCRAVNDYIDKLGLASRMACLTPERIARIALDGSERGRAVIIPGFLNRFLPALGDLLPLSVSMHTIRKYWGRYGEMTREGATA
jgi:uncharacterized protein